MVEKVQKKRKEGQGSQGKMKGLYFVCPRCGRIPRDEVIFVCNTCGSQEMVEKDGMILCPQCLTPGKNFQCFLCGSKEVEMKTSSPRKTKS